jgi:hypothetical protein
MDNKCAGVNCEWKKQGKDGCCLDQYGDIQLTEWMHCLDHKPVRKGMYQVATIIGGLRFRLFDGENWIKEDGSVATYAGLSMSKWRGLSEPNND